MKERRSSSGRRHLYVKKGFWVPYEDSTNYPTLASDLTEREIGEFILLLQ